MPPKKKTSSPKQKTKNPLIEAQTQVAVLQQLLHEKSREV